MCILRGVREGPMQYLLLFTALGERDLEQIRFLLLFIAL